MKPRERICEGQRSDTTDAGRSHDKGNVANVVRPDYTHSYYTFYLFKISTYLEEYAILDAAKSHRLCVCRGCSRVFSLQSKAITVISR